jgi:hypothetical protein
MQDWRQQQHKELSNDDHHHVHETDRQRNSKLSLISSTRSWPSHSTRRFSCVPVPGTFTAPAVPAVGHVRGAEIAERVHPFEPIIERMDAIPGIGRRVAEVLVAEVGTDMSRFPTAAQPRLVGRRLSWQ